MIRTFQIDGHIFGDNETKIDAKHAYSGQLMFTLQLGFGLPFTKEKT